MQTVRYFVRAIGDKGQGMGIVSAKEAEDDLNYNYLSTGFAIQSTQYLGAMRDQQGNEVAYRLLHVLVKEEELKKAK